MLEQAALELCEEACDGVFGVVPNYRIVCERGHEGVP